MKALLLCLALAGCDGARLTEWTRTPAEDFTVKQDAFVSSEVGPEDDPAGDLGVAALGGSFTYFKIDVTKEILRPDIIVYQIGGVERMKVDCDNVVWIDGVRVGKIELPPDDKCPEVTP